VKVKVKAFGISRDIMGEREVELEMAGDTVAHLRQALGKNYPSLMRLTSLLIAVNQQYAKDTTPLHERDEIALIPPVSGG
jgi:molybdopterin converting factor subunit 1